MTNRSIGQPMSVVLQIDDDPAMRRVVERILLRRPEVRLLSAGGGRDGLQIVRDERPDLVIADLHLPDLSGRALLGALKAEPALRHIPVVIMSGDSGADQIEEMMRAGAADYVTKPFGLDDLLEVVDRHTGGAGHLADRVGAPDRSPEEVTPRADPEPLPADAVERLRRLHRGGPSGDGLIRDFIADAEDVVRSLSANLATGDLDVARRLAHNLAGSSGMFAADVLGRLAAQVELHLTAGDGEAAGALVAELRAEVDRVAQALHRLFPGALPRPG